MKKSIRTITIALCCLLHAGMNGQTFNFRHFNEQNGLKDVYIYRMAQARDGELYFATGGTVTKFDGVEFTKVYDAASQNRFISSLFIDSRNVLWMGLQQNGILYRKNGTYLLVKDSALSSAKVTGFCEAPGGRVYIATLGAGLWYTDSLFRLREVQGSPKKFNAICRNDASGKIIGATEEGLWIFDTRTGTGKFALSLLHENIKNVVNGAANSVFTLGEDGVHKFEISGNDVWDIYGPQTDKRLSGEEITAIGADRHGTLWLFSQTEGLLRVREPGLFSGALVFRHFGAPQGFMARQVQQIFEDQEGSMWFGTYGDGLFQKPPQRFTYFGIDEIGPIKDVSTLLMVHDSDLWLGGNDGLARFNIRSAIYQPVNTGVEIAVNCLARDKRGYIWIGTEHHGIITYNPEKDTFGMMNKRLGEPIETVNQIYAHKGKIYCCTASGLIIFHEKNKNMEWLRTNEGLFHNNVKNIFCDSQDRLWIASYGSPPYYIANQMVFPFKKIKGLRSYDVNAYCEDKDGKIWIATEGDGLFSYDTAFVQYTTRDGLASDFCNGLVYGSDSTLWVTHRNGLSQLEKNNTRFRQFTKPNGIKYADFCRNSACASKHGRVYFACRNALVQYDGELGKPGNVMPETQITLIRIDKENYEAGEKIEKEYGYYNVRIEFKSASLADPSAIRYRYRLLGTDTAWQYTTSRFVDYQKLADGRFEFEVSAINDNYWNADPTPARASIVIRPPFWRSLWFYLMLFALAMVVSYIVVVIRTNSLNKTKKMLELKVREKTYLLQKEKDSVEEIKQVMEKKNKDITDSINYAKKIQYSILPSDELLHQLFPGGYFVLFEPKDIVSGDFYWASTLTMFGYTKATLAVAAVVDCTGHGVPGAFLSIMANDVLRQSMVDGLVNKPGDVLNFLNKKISLHLNQNSKTQINDGMDIAIVGIDYKTGILHYSGANNPVYVLRKNGKATDLIILKGIRRAIGMMNKDTAPFPNNEFKMKSGDRICMFSDGYPDQFGGQSGKKMGHKRFRELLIASAHLSMAEQKDFLRQKFNEWKNTEHQTDDMCLMSIQIG